MKPTLDEDGQKDMEVLRVDKNSRDNEMVSVENGKVEMEPSRGNKFGSIPRKLSYKDSVLAEGTSEKLNPEEIA